MRVLSIRLSRTLRCLLAEVWCARVLSPIAPVDRLRGFRIFRHCINGYVFWPTFPSSVGLSCHFQLPRHFIDWEHLFVDLCHCTSVYVDGSLICSCSFTYCSCWSLERISEYLRHCVSMNCVRRILPLLLFACFVIRWCPVSVSVLSRRPYISYSTLLSDSL